MRSASALATAGNTIEESIGLIVAANDVVQNPEAVGTAMKTLSMYMRSMKTEAEEAGLSTDGMAESTSKLRAELLALTGGKLDIQIDDKHLKSTYQVLQELSEIWDEIGRVSENNQARILEMLGGKRNANVLSSIITNFDDAVAAMKTAGNSAGSAWMENEKYLNSVEGKTKQVQAAFEAFANSVINSDIVKTWLDIQKGILNAGSALNEIGMLLPTIAAGMTAIKGIMDSMKASNAANQIVTYLNAGNAPNSDSIQSIIAGLTKGQQKALSVNLGNLIQTEGAVTGLRNVVDLLNKNVGATNTFKSSLASMGATAKTVFAGIKASFASMGIAAVISLAIEGIVKLVQWISTAKQRAVEAAQEVTNAYKEQADSTSDNISRLTKLEAEYKELNAKAGANGTQGSLNASEYERYKKIIEEIAAISPSVVSGFTKEGAALKDYNTVIQDAIKYQTELLENQKRVLVNDADKVYSGAKAQISDLYGEMKKYSYEIYDAFSPTRGNVFGNNGTEEAKNWLSILDTVGIKLDEIVEKTGAKNVEYHTSRISDVWLRSYDYLEQVYAKQDQIREAMIASGNYEVNQVSDVVNKIANLSKVLPKYEGYVKSVQDVLIAFADTDLGIASVLDRDQLTPAQLNEYYQGIMQIADANKKFIDQKEEVKEYTREFSMFLGLYDEIASVKGTGNIERAWRHLQEKYKDWPYLLDMIHDALFDVTEASKENADAVDDQTKSYSDLAKEMDNISKATSFLSSLRSDNKDTFSLLKSAQDFVDMYNGLFPGENEQIDLGDIFSVTEDNLPDWDTAAVEVYTEAIIRAAFMHTELEKTNPGFIDALVKEAIAFRNAKNEAQSFSDALSGINNASSIDQAIRDFDGSDTAAMKIISDLQGVVDAWNKIRGENDQVSLGDFFDYGPDGVDFSKAGSLLYDFRMELMSNSEAITKLEAQYPGFTKWLAYVDPAAESAEKGLTSLTDAMGSMGDVMSIITSGLGSDDPIEKIQKATKTLEMWQGILPEIYEGWEVPNLSNLLTIDENGIRENAEGFKSLWNDLVTFVTTSTDLDLTDEQRETLKTLLPQWLTDSQSAEEAAANAKKISDAMSGLGNAASYLNEHIQGEAVGNNFYDALESFYDLREKLGKEDEWSFGDFFHWDEDLGDYTYKTELLSNEINNLAKTIATDLVDSEIKGGAAIEDRTAAIEERAKRISESLIGVSDSWQKLTSTVSSVKSLQGLKEDYQSYQSGDMSLLDMLSSAASLAEELGLEIDEAFTIGADGKMVLNIENLDNALIGVIDKLEASGACSATLAAQLREAARAEAAVASNAERLQKASEKVRDAQAFGSGRTRAQQLTYDDYKSMIERDARYANTVEYVNGVMSINRDLYNETTKEIAAETAQMALLEAAQRKLKIDELQKKLSKLTSAEKDQKSIIEKEIEKLKLEAKGYTILANEISNATNQFERFRNAAGEADDETYMDAQSALKMIEDVMYNMESEFYGRVGNEKFKEAIRLLVDPEFDFEKGDLRAAVAEVYAKLQEYFGQGTEENPRTSRNNMNSFFNDLLEAGFASTKVDEAGRKWGELKGTVSEIADTFGLTDDAVRAALNELEEFSQVGFNWKEIDPEYFQRLKADAEELAKAIDEADQKAAKVSTDAEKARKEADEAAERLERAQKLSEGEDLSGLEQAAKEADEKAKALEDAAKSAKQAADELHGAQEESSTEKLRKSLEELVEQIEKLTSEPIELNFGSTLESTKEVANELFRMAELLDQMNAINASMAEIGKTTDATHGKVDDLGKAEVNIKTKPALDSMGYVIDTGSRIMDMVEDICSMWLDLDPNPAIDSIQAVIDSLEVMAEAVNDVNKLSLSTASTKKSSTSVTQYASGTDSAKGGKSLVGELGREMVVDVNSGRWYTVGNNGPEFVNLPKRAVVFNHEKTAELLGDTPIKLHGRAFASGTGNLAGTYNNSAVGGGMINIAALNTPEKQKETKKATAAYQEEAETVESLAEAYKLANEQLEHLIKHEEQNYYIAERAANFDKMHTFLANEVEIYKKIMENSQRGIDALKAAGADDGDKDLQELEEAYWSAYRSMYEALDNIRSLYSDALGEEVDNIQSAYKNLTAAIKEYNDTGLISIDTFQAILDNGIEYLGLLQDENGMFDVSTNAVRDLLKYRKDQLAIETAIAYVSRLNEALKNGESQKVAELVNATGQIGRNTWDIVYANLELLKTQGLSDELYQSALSNIDKLRDLTDVTMDDFISEDAIEETKERFDELNKQIEHYIAHQKFAYDVGERGMDFTAMNTALSNEVEYYKQIMDEAQKTIAELTMLGADDTNEALQSVEESYWSAYRSIYSALDSIRKLRVDALSDRLNGLTGAFGTLKNAADEYSKSGGISLDTLESLLNNGFQYMSLLDAQDGKYVINTERVNAYVNARKNQLAVENALSYISEVREAIENKESDRLQHLVDSMDAVTNSTWDYVYAQAALLKASMSSAQYDAFIANIDKMRTLADSVVYDYASGAGDVTEEYDKQSEALGDILKYTEDLIRAETKDKIDALNDQVEAYKKIIDLKKESIDKTKDENEYQEEVAEKVKAIAELQARADLLSLDTSRTASAERQKLLQEIADKQKELADYQNDYSIDAQKEALDKDYEDYEASRQAEIEELEKSISSEEKVYQLAIARIRDQWGTLYQDLIAWNTEEGSVINQEITEAWEAATKAVEKYGNAVRAIDEMTRINSGDNVVVADIPKYHSGGIVGDRGSINEDEVLAVLKKGELVATEPMKKAMFAAVNFVKELSDRIGTKVESIRNFAMTGISGGFTPAFAMPAASAPVTQNNSISFSPNISVAFNGVDMGGRDAESFGRDVANSVADNLFDKFNSRGINILHRLRQ